MSVQQTSKASPEGLQARAESWQCAQRTTEKCLKVCLVIMAFAIFIIGVLSALGHLDGVVGGRWVIGLSVPLVLGAPLSLAGWPPPPNLLKSQQPSSSTS
jgi:hypothetical protein